MRTAEDFMRERAYVETSAVELDRGRAAGATTMKERPILFSAPMVLAILRGSKTQTRRLVPAGAFELDGDSVPDSGAPGGVAHVGGWAPGPCRYGTVGDRLWVKESWSAPPAYDHLKPTDLTNNTPIRYSADGVVRGVSKRFVDAEGRYVTGRGRPSIFMRRWMSRITLEITDVRVERLQSITPEDVVAEGVGLRAHKCDCEFCARTSALCPATQSSLVLAWIELWDGINGDRATWASDPWIWKITFRRVTP